MMRGESAAIVWYSRLVYEVDTRVLQMSQMMAYMFYGQIQREYQRNTGRLFTTVLSPIDYMGIDRSDFPQDLCDPKLDELGIPLDEGCP